jgi:hypothetical protein
VKTSNPTKYKKYVNDFGRGTLGECPLGSRLKHMEISSRALKKYFWRMEAEWKFLRIASGFGDTASVVIPSYPLFS